MGKKTFTTPKFAVGDIVYFEYFSGRRTEEIKIEPRYNGFTWMYEFGEGKEFIALGEIYLKRLEVPKELGPNDCVICGQNGVGCGTCGKVFCIFHSEIKDNQTICDSCNLAKIPEVSKIQFDESNEKQSRLNLYKSFWNELSLSMNNLQTPERIAVYITVISELVEFVPIDKLKEYITEKQNQAGK